MEEKLEAILDKYVKSEGNIISILQDIQNKFGYILEHAVNWFSDKLDIPASRFYCVVACYSQFHLKPRGGNIITTCCSTACYLNGAVKTKDGLRRDLHLANGENTSADGKFTHEEVSCLGACSFAATGRHASKGDIAPRFHHLKGENKQETR
jgi:NADH-quinone oxidoreductase subunit E